MGPTPSQLVCPCWWFVGHGHVMPRHVLSRLVTSQARHVVLLLDLSYEISVYMDTSSAEDRDRLRQAIDHEIKVLEDTLQSSKRRRNALVPISRLPPETLAMIFSFLSSSAFDEDADYLKWLHATHVCHQWRETALNYPHLWSHINFAKLRPAGIAEILARAKMAHLHLEAKINHWSKARFEAFERQLEAHISHTLHLSISGEFQTGLERLVSPAPVLEVLSLSNISHPFEFPPPVIPDTIFDGIAPKLANLELSGCNMSWKSPLLKGLQTLQILRPSEEARPTLEDWLDALNEMSQLKTLILHSSTPVAFDDNMLISEPRRSVTLPSLTRFNISASAKDCALALAHLVLPALNCLHVAAKSHEWDGEDVRLVIPHIARNACGPQDTAPLQTIVLSGGRTHAEIFVWSVPDADDKVLDSNTLLRMAVSARLVFSATTNASWRDETDTEIFDDMVTHLPMNTISSLLAQNHTPFSKGFWLRHAPRLAMLKRVRLVRTSVKPFRQMLAEDAPPGGPLRLPSLTNLILDDVLLTALRTYHLRDMLIKRKEQGAPLETLDLHTCIASQRAIQLLAEVVGDVKGPAETQESGDPALFDWRGGVTFFNEEEERTYDDEYDGGTLPWYDGRDFEEEDEEEDEDVWDDYDDDSDPYDEL